MLTYAARRRAARPGRRPARRRVARLARPRRGRVLRGEFSTGALKAVGSLGLAPVRASGHGLRRGRGEYLLAVALLVLTTNLFNLLDLRPGRSVKAFVLLGVAADARRLHGRTDFGSFAPLWVVGLFAAPVLVAGFYDLRERAMLGDTGANLIGALAGLWLVYASTPPAS